MLQPVPVITEDDTNTAQNHRVVPHNEEAERGLLGAILLNNDVLHKIEETTLPEHFYIPVHARIFEKILHVVDVGQIANPISLRTYFEDDMALGEVGGGAYLMKLADNAATVEPAVAYAKIIRELYIRRQLIEIGSDVVNDAYDSRNTEDSAAQIDRAEKSLYDLAVSGTHEQQFRSMRELTPPAVNVIAAAVKGDGITGLSSGFADLDNLIGGLKPSDLIVIAARPSVGKTAIATDIALNVASRSTQDNEGNVVNPVVAFFTLEMTSEQLVARMLSVKSAIPSSLLNKGSLEQREFDTVVDASQYLSRIPLYIDDTAAIPVHTLQARARRLKRKKPGLALVVVDYLQLIRSSERFRMDNRTLEVTEVSQTLKALAKELDVPVVACAQLSREVEKRPKHRPILSDLRESGSIEQDADIVAFLYREAVYHKQNEPSPSADAPEGSEKFLNEAAAWQDKFESIRNVAALIVAKNRHGPTGLVDLHFDDNTMHFSSLDKRYSDSYGID